MCLQVSYTALRETSLPAPSGPGDPLPRIPVVLNITWEHVRIQSMDPTPELLKEKLWEWGQRLS